MKAKVLMLAAMACCFMMISCGDDEKEEEVVPESLGIDVVGMWVPTEKPDSIYFYWEFTKTDVNYYELKSDSGNFASYKQDGFVYVPKDAEWSMEITQKYVIKGKNIYVQDINLGGITVINNDEVTFDSDLLIDGRVQRIKGFRTMEN